MTSLRSVLDKLGVNLDDPIDVALSKLYEFSSSYSNSASFVGLKLLSGMDSFSKLARSMQNTIERVNYFILNLRVRILQATRLHRNLRAREISTQVALGNHLESIRTSLAALTKAGMSTGNNIVAMLVALRANDFLRSSAHSQWLALAKRLSAIAEDAQATSRRHTCQQFKELLEEKNRSNKENNRRLRELRSEMSRIESSRMVDAAVRIIKTQRLELAAYSVQNWENYNRCLNILRSYPRSRSLSALGNKVRGHLMDVIYSPRYRGLSVDKIAIISAVIEEQKSNLCSLQSRHEHHIKGFSEIKCLAKQTRAHLQNLIEARYQRLAAWKSIMLKNRNQLETAGRTTATANNISLLATVTQKASAIAHFWGESFSHSMIKWKLMKSSRQKWIDSARSNLHCITERHRYLKSIMLVIDDAKLMLQARTEHIQRVGLLTNRLKVKLQTAGSFVKDKSRALRRIRDLLNIYSHATTSCRRAEQLRQRLELITIQSIRIVKWGTPLNLSMSSPRFFSVTLKISHGISRLGASLASLASIRLALISRSLRAQCLAKESIRISESTNYSCGRDQMRLYHMARTMKEFHALLKSRKRKTDHIQLLSARVKDATTVLPLLLHKLKASRNLIPSPRNATFHLLQYLPSFHERQRLMSAHLSGLAKTIHTLKLLKHKNILVREAALREVEKRKRAILAEKCKNLQADLADTESELIQLYQILQLKLQQDSRARLMPLQSRSVLEKLVRSEVECLQRVQETPLLTDRASPHVSEESVNPLIQLQQNLQFRQASKRRRQRSPESRCYLH